MTLNDQHFVQVSPIHSGSARPSETGFASLNPARLERCEYCSCSRHLCGCEDRFEYEQIRDNPELILMGQSI